MRLIVNADDFGLTHGVTYGIYDAFLRGIVSSTTMMVNADAAPLAANIARATETLGVGLHINISLGEPLCDCPSLVENGRFVKPCALLNDDCYDEYDLEREFAAQYERFVALTEKKPTHLDSHLYAHQRFPKVARQIRALADRHGLPVRDAPTAHFERIEFEGGFKLIEGEGIGELKERFFSLMRRLARFETAELMVHPGFTDGRLLATSSYNIQRTVEHTVLTDADISDYLRLNKIEKATYLDCR